MQHILFPVDFSAQCDLTAPAVAAVARRLGAGISLLHTVRLPALRSEFAPLQHHFRTAMEEMEGGLRDYQHDIWSGLTVEHYLRPGDPAEQIVTFADQQNVDLIMMPTRGATRFRQLLLGSVTASVLHDAQCPVWTTAHAESIQPFAPYRSILCAIDLSPHSVSVLRTARYFAAQFDAQLHIMHAVGGASGHATGALADAAVVRYGALAAEAELPPDTKLDLIEGVPLIDAVHVSAAGHHADLLVIGRGRIQGTLGRLRTNAHTLIRVSRCPVLSV